MAEKNVESAQPSRSQGVAEGVQASGSTPQSGEERRGRSSGALRRRLSSAVLGGRGLSLFSLVRRMLEDLDRLFEHVRGRASGDDGGGIARTPAFGGVVAQAWSPAIDVFERDGRLVISADLPGLSADQVRIEIRDDMVVLEGERNLETEVEEEGGYRFERVYGRFSRVIPLPEGAEVESAQARFENGVLEIEIPMREDASRRRRIEIQEGSQDRPADTRRH
jgi:HSP20 family protein